MLYARLDRTERRVLCGVIDCGAEIARVVDEYTKGRVFPGEPPNYRAVWMGPGWDIRPDGVWALTSRAKRQMRRAQLTGCGGLTGSRKTPVDSYREKAKGHVQGWLAYDLPFDVICPQCGSRQTIDPKTLNVTPNRLPARRLKVSCVVSGCPNMAMEGYLGCEEHPLPAHPLPKGAPQRPRRDLGVQYELTI